MLGGYPLICRFCLIPNQPNDTFQVFDETDDIPGKVLELTKIKVSKEDGKPQELCSSCREQLDLSITFKKQVETANQMLDNHLIDPQQPTCKSPVALITGDLVPEFINVERESTQDNQDFVCPEDTENAADVPSWESVPIKVEEEFVIADPWPEANLDPTVEDVIKSHLPVKLENLVEVKRETKPTITLVGNNVAVIKEEGNLTESLPDVHMNQIKQECIAPHPRLVEDSEEDEKEHNGHNKYILQVEHKKNTKALSSTGSAVDRGFRCKICSKKYQNKFLLRKHVRLHSSSKCNVLGNIKCRHCDRLFPSIRSLNGHLRLHVERQSSPQTNSSPIQNEADYSHHNKSNVDHLSHVNTMVETELNVDPETGDETHTVRRSSRAIKVPEHFDPETNSERQKDQNLNDSRQSCDDGTRRSSRTIKAPERHVVPHYSCSKCERMYNDQATLENHERTHVTQFFKCNHCGRKFNDKDGLANHIEKRHLISTSRSKRSNQSFKKKGHECDICGKTYEKRNHLFSHMRIHKSLVKLCEICGKTVNHNAYFQHKRSHLITGSDEVFQCDSCDKKFNNKLSLRSHKKANHGDLKFTCEICGKMFTTMALMKHHQNIHSGKREHVCPVCNRAFTLKVTLKAHMRIHTGEMPYACETCGRCFTWKTTYRNHVATCKTSGPPVESKYVSTSLPPNVVHYTTQNIPQESPIDYSEDTKYRPPSEEDIKYEEEVKYPLFPPNQTFAFPAPYMRDDIKYTYQQPLNFAGDVKTFIREFKPS